VYEQIAANKRKTVLLIFGAIVLLGAVGYALGLWAGSGLFGLVGAVALAIVLSLGSFFGGDRLVGDRSRHHGRTVTASLTVREAQKCCREQHQQKHTGQPGQTDANPLHPTLSLLHAPVRAPLRRI